MRYTTQYTQTDEALTKIRKLLFEEIKVTLPNTIADAIMEIIDDAITEIEDNRYLDSRD